MSVPPVNAKTLDLTGMDIDQEVKAIRAVLMENAYIYQRGKIVYLTSTQWWNDDDLREDGYEPYRSLPQS